MPALSILVQHKAGRVSHCDWAKKKEIEGTHTRREEQNSPYDQLTWMSINKVPENLFFENDTSRTNNEFRKITKHKTEYKNQSNSYILTLNVNTKMKMSLSLKTTRQI